MTLVLVRHAQSRGNAAGTVQGWRDEPLTALGREQASALAERLSLSRPPITALYSSTLARARETADPLARAVGVEVIAEPDLREYGYGAAEGLRWAEVEERLGVGRTRWRGGTLPGEEGPEAFGRRVLRRVGELAGRHRDDHAAAVTHGGVIGAVLAHVLGVASDAWPRLHLPNCSVVVLDGAPDDYALLSLNGDGDLSALIAATGARGGRRSARETRGAPR